MTIPTPPTPPATLAEMREWVSGLKHDYEAWCRGNRPDLPDDFWRTVRAALHRLRVMERENER